MTTGRAVEPLVTFVIPGCWKVAPWVNRDRGVVLLPPPPSTAVFTNGAKRMVSPEAVESERVMGALPAATCLAVVPGRLCGSA